MTDNRITTREIKIRYFRKGVFLYQQTHIIWDFDKFIAKLTADCEKHKADKKDDSNFTAFQIA